MSKFIDLTGKKFGRLTVLSEDARNKNGRRTYLCSCECGNTKVINGDSMRHGRTKSCGCLNKEVISRKRHKDLTGMRFNDLTVISLYGYDKNGDQLWNCICVCGNKTISLAGNLRGEKSKSCGCKRSTYSTHGATKGKNRLPEYKVWCGIKSRCNTESDTNYKNYGARGIKVCDRWDKSFEKFIEDVGMRPSPQHSIDRIDVNGDYTPENCKWATTSEQMLNRRILKNNKTGVTGVSYRVNRDRYIANITIDKKRIRLGSFKTLEEATKAREKAELEFLGKSSL